MNAKILLKVNRFGQVGKIVMTILMVIAIAVTLLCGTAAIYTTTLPRDAVKVTVTDHAEFKIDKSVFSSVWSLLTEDVSYVSDNDPSAMLKNDADGKLLPPENTELDTELNFFDQSYLSATVRSEGEKKIIEARSGALEYSSSDLVTLLVFVTLFVASVAAALLMLQKLFKAISVCESPFCAELVSKLRIFGYSLLPVAVFASIGETLAVRFLSAGKGAAVSVQWGLLIAFGVVMCLVTVFRYGVQLQKESDETL